ncbi:uncharacterized protein LTHEOB_5978 [Lasiodiplodia theobromae]|uniref:Uncharacterized protein n=1 Tax=Lasiodiplodia theobromae TaxID=45133 RepID=A0A5N5D711_9PEZI|nr:uncharacterized protein LTHEOB_5978 [Lasiodiplodia theobromae]KAB2573508.1 hypothetical protein DBV05_g7795 [Lasiodiplodia theobromae]KAF4544408.1 hypothetical protein LTHEOB_5978 [Lasiodiplodia theobromae]
MKFSTVTGLLLDYSQTTLAIASPVNIQREAAPCIPDDPTSNCDAGSQKREAAPCVPNDPTSNCDAGSQKRDWSLPIRNNKREAASCIPDDPTSNCDVGSR